MTFTPTDYNPYDFANRRHIGPSPVEMEEMLAAVGVGEAPRVDLVHDGLTPPVGVLEGGMRSGSGEHVGHQPLTAPWVTPSITQRCVKR